MEDLKNKLGYSSFAELSWEEIDKSLLLLRHTKYLFCKCAENCYSQEELPWDEWERVRPTCMNQCKNAHDSIFQAFNQDFPRFRDECVGCVLSCSTEYPISKFGEEDLRICEEKCYEKLYSQAKIINSQLGQAYQDVYLEKFKDSSHTSY